MLPKTLAFRRRLDGLSYRYRLAGSRNGAPSWQRADLNLWVVKDEHLGWVVTDAGWTVLSVPWAVAVSEQGDLPPEGEWVSKKGDRSKIAAVLLKRQ